VALIKLAWVAEFKTSLQSWNMDENSAHIVCFRFLVFAEVICICREVKDLFGQQPQNRHVVLAYRQTCMAGGDDFVDEGGPVMRPFLLEDGDEDEVELVDEGSLGFKGFFGARGLDDEADNEVADSWTPQSAHLPGQPQIGSHLDTAPLEEPSTWS
jgi:hypothetical protein